MDSNKWFFLLRLKFYIIKRKKAPPPPPFTLVYIKQGLLCWAGVLVLISMILNKRKIWYFVHKKVKHIKRFCKFVSVTHKKANNLFFSAPYSQFPFHPFHFLLSLLSLWVIFTPPPNLLKFIFLPSPLPIAGGMWMYNQCRVSASLLAVENLGKHEYIKLTFYTV